MTGRFFLISGKPKQQLDRYKTAAAPGGRPPPFLPSSRGILQGDNPDCRALREQLSAQPASFPSTTVRSTCGYERHVGLKYAWLHYCSRVQWRREKLTSGSLRRHVLRRSRARPPVIDFACIASFLPLQIRCGFHAGVAALRFAVVRSPRPILLCGSVCCGSTWLPLLPPK